MTQRNSVLALATMLATMDSMGSGYREKNSLRPEDINLTPKKRIIPKGCQVFVIEGVEIVAINEKSAIRKYKKHK